MPGIQNLGQPGVQNLQRQHLDAGPLGQVGNLRFKTGPGATPRASAPNVFQRFGQFLSKVAFYVGASPARRAQQFVLDQARDNSRRVGNLLGNLTAPPNDPKARSKIAEGLARLGDLSGGDLSSLPGGKESLKTYLGELGVMDLNALRGGVLGDPEARQAVIDRVDPPRLRAQAARLLDQITAALDQELAGQAVKEPLARIQALLAARPVDGTALEGQLARLSENLAMLGGDKFDTYLQGLSDAELKALQSVLNPDKREAVKASLGQIRDPDVRPLAPEDAPDMRHDTLDPQLVQNGRIRQGEALLDRLGGALDGEIQARIERTHPDVTGALRTAVASGDPKAITRALFDLNQQVYDLQGIHGRLPSGTSEALRAQMALAMDALRDPETNPEGPLTRDSLARLNDFDLGLLRRSGELRAFGLRLDLDGARVEGLSRVQGLTDQVVHGMTGLLHALSEEDVDMPALVRQLRDLSDLELQRTWQLGNLGHYGHLADVDSRKAMIGEAFRAALDGLRQSGQDEAAERALGRLNLLLSLEGAFGGAAFGLNEVISEGGFVQGASEAVRRISTTQHMLDGITSTIHRILTEESGEPVIEPVDLPDAFHASLVEQYGVRFDPERFSTTLVLRDDVLARLAPHLEAPIDPGIHPTRTVTLPVRGTDTEFSVGSSFFKDGIERPSISLSVRGARMDGGMARSTWPGEVSGDTRDQAMGEALDALFKVAGPAAEPLTRLMNQQLGAGILQGLQDMGKDSPFRLEDGSVVLPVGAGNFHFDVDKLDDGSFRVVGKMTIPIQDAVGFDERGNAVPVSMDPEVSWAQVQVTLTVSPDGLRFRMSEPPQFRHHFVLTESRHD